MNIEVYSQAINQPVMRLPSRAFPGILLQGDTLSSHRGWLQEVQEILSRVQRNDPTLDEAKEALDAIVEDLDNLLKHYEATIEKAGFRKPY